MAPKKRASATTPAASGPAKKATRRKAASSPTQSTSGEEVQTTAPENVLRELANALEQTGRAMPAIRKIWLPEEGGWPEGMHVSVYDSIRALKGGTQQNASNELQRIQERYGDRSTNCRPVSFADSRGRVDPNRKTPVADALGMLYNL